MLTERTQALLAAVEHQVDANQAALVAERERIKALEAENRALRERLLALAELDPMMSKGQVGSEAPDGGTRARGLGSLAFRRPRHKPEVADGKRVASPLQRLTSPLPSAEVPVTPAPEAHVAPEPQEDAARERNPAPTPGDHIAQSSAGDLEASPNLGQHSLALGAEHEPPSPYSLLSQWYARYPQTFFKGHTRPLKTGIHLDLCELEPWPEKLVRRALACYVHLPRYLKSVREGARRVDINGGESEVVTAEEANHAKRQLDVLQKKQKTREAEHRSTKLDRKLGELLAKHGQRSSE